MADFSHLLTQCRYVAFMPQWDFLNFLADEGGRYHGFQVRMSAEVTDVIAHNGAVIGLRAETAQGPLDVRAALVVGADGRHSIIRKRAELSVEEFGAPMDVLWFRLSRKAQDPVDPIGRFDVGRIFIMLNRDDYWQCGSSSLPRDHWPRFKPKASPAFRESVAKLAPFAADRVYELQGWEPIKLLTVQATGCGNGISPAFSVSVTRTTPCRRSGESAST